MNTAEILKKVRQIEIKTGRLVSETFAGQYQSVFKGRGVEFSDVREYVPGDDIRSIDWNVTARCSKPFVKNFVEERELTLMILCDVSASHAFGSGAKPKSEAAAELAAMFAFSALKNSDKTGLLLKRIALGGRLLLGELRGRLGLLLLRLRSHHGAADRGSGGDSEHDGNCSGHQRTLARLM